MSDEPIKYEDLPAEHKKKYDELKAIFEADLIGSFEKTRSHGIRFKGFTPEGAFEGLDLSLPSEERTRALRQEINYAVAHSLHRHSESLVNTLERVALRVVQEIMKHQYSPSGPALGTYQGEIPFHTRPPLPFAMAAPQQQGSPAYVVYKSGQLNLYSSYCGSDQRNLRDQFGILPKKKTIGYSKPYPNEYDLIPLPPKYRLPDFTKFSGSEGSSSIEHVSRYLAQLGMVSASEQLRVRFFAQSLTGPAFGWYTLLPPDSVRTWKQLEEQFHIQYHSEATEAGIADLTQVRQRRGETVSEYIQRFRTVKNRCYSVHLSEKEAVELAVAGLAAPLKDLTFQVEYNSLAHMVQRLTSYEQRHPELYQDKFKRTIGLVDAEEEDPMEDQEIAVAEWTRTPVPVSCKWVKQPGPPRGMTDVGATTWMTKDIVGLMQMTGGIVDMIETMKGMSRLPTIENCPECRPQRKGTKEVSVFKRLGPLPPQNKRAESSQDEDFEESDEEEDRYHRPRWCPDGLSHSQKRRVQRLRNWRKPRQYLYTLRKARPDLAVKIQQTLEWRCAR
ncbi:hypothetical protein QYE76_056622 [Lolium multiflorum]|uniref:Retrotransposon gag domain-containing protein n=1 Tax=Lolium multiflorum TaxID=4521 RepID=A0AAD8T3P8_LOLMU|nr:hypothetical protein QYE76_056622 [Lolium multiflorum]